MTYEQAVSTVLKCKEAWPLTDEMKAALRVIVAGRPITTEEAEACHYH